MSSRGRFTCLVGVLWVLGCSSGSSTDTVDVVPEDVQGSFDAEVEELVGEVGAPDVDLLFEEVAPELDAQSDQSPWDGSSQDTAPDLTAEELLLGIWSQPGTIAMMRFNPDGTVQVALGLAKLDEDPLGAGTWTLEGSILTFTNTQGVCSQELNLQVGIYDIEVSETSLLLEMVDDACPERNVIDGQTWSRVGG